MNGYIKYAHQDTAMGSDDGSSISTDMDTDDDVDLEAKHGNELDTDIKIEPVIEKSKILQEPQLSLTRGEKLESDEIGCAVDDNTIDQDTETRITGGEKGLRGRGRFGRLLGWPKAMKYAFVGPNGTESIGSPIEMIKIDPNAKTMQKRCKLCAKNVQSVEKHLLCHLVKNAYHVHLPPMNLSQNSNLICWTT